MSDDDSDEEYKFNCNACGKIFKDPSGLRKHKNKCQPDKLEENRKEALNKRMVSKAKKEAQKLLEEQQKQTQKLLMEKEEEINRLRKLVEEQNSLKEQQNSLNEIKNEIIEKNNEILEKNNEIIAVVRESAVGSGTYNLTNNNLTNNSLTQTKNFNIQLAPKEKERFDHIPPAQILHILDQEDFSKSIADMVQAVSFNPKAPENMTWCVNDKKAEAGAIEYNAELNMLTTDSTTSVISKNLQSILFPVTDILKEIELTNKLNMNQNRNCLRYFNMLGETEYKREYINSIKERAFDKRGLCKALWEHLQIGFETSVLKAKRLKII